MVTSDDHPEQQLQAYEARTGTALFVLALAFLGVYAIPVIWPDLPVPADRALNLASLAIWVVFAVDLVIRTLLSKRRMRFLIRHPIDVLTVLLPALRPLRALRVFAGAQALFTRQGQFPFLKTTQAVVVSAALLLVVASVAILDVERGVPGSTINDFGDAMWWGITTVTTVGYGDTYPVTGVGRIIAAALMLVGISLVGAVTATVAAWFVDQSRAKDAPLA